MKLIQALAATAIAFALVGTSRAQEVFYPGNGVSLPVVVTEVHPSVEKVILDDYQRLWNNNALANLSIEIRDFQFSNGVIGKLVSYNITERN
jgi:hypothetical protein